MFSSGGGSKKDASPLLLNAPMHRRRRRFLLLGYCSVPSLFPAILTLPLSIHQFRNSARQIVISVGLPGAVLSHVRLDDICKATISCCQIREVADLRYTQAVPCVCFPVFFYFQRDLLLQQGLQASPQIVAVDSTARDPNSRMDAAFHCLLKCCFRL